MRSAKDFFEPMALGAPAPMREIPFRPSRMIHFFDPSNARMAAKVPSMVPKCDVLLGNLEDAIQADNKIAAREGLIEIARATDFGNCQLWTRINSLDSPLGAGRPDPPGQRNRRQARCRDGAQGGRRLGTSTTWTDCWPSSKRGPG